jgi:hypothetical protein
MSIPVLILRIGWDLTASAIVTAVLCLFAREIWRMAPDEDRHDGAHRP